MKIVAKAIKGQEFFYNYKTAHKVSERSANKICKALNDAKYKIKDDEVWHVFDVGMYDNAYAYASTQEFRRVNMGLREYAY